MANTPQAKKRARQAEKHRQHNASQRSAMRTTLKNTLKVLSEGDKTAAEQAFRAASASVDVAARKGLIHPNKAARHKSRLNRRLSALA